jgi:hypothetical protein
MEKLLNYMLLARTLISRTQYLLHIFRFFKADDDTYVFMRHLRSFLAKYNPKDPHYFGPFKQKKKN